MSCTAYIIKPRATTTVLILAISIVSDRGIQSLIALNNVVTALVWLWPLQPELGLISRQPYQVTVVWYVSAGTHSWGCGLVGGVPAQHAQSPGCDPQDHINQAWWLMVVTSGMWEVKAKDQEFETSLKYRMSRLEKSKQASQQASK